LNPTPKEALQETKVLTIADALELWAGIQRQRTKEDTIRKIKNAFKNLMPDTNMLLADTEGIRALVIQRLGVVSLVNNTKHKQLSWVRQFFGFCVAEGYCERNPITKAMFPKQTKIERDAFTDTELDTI
jgi:site-specific recombinase XerD